MEKEKNNLLEAFAVSSNEELYEYIKAHPTEPKVKELLEIFIQYTEKDRKGENDVIH